MYAVIKTGGKQYRVSKDDVITIEKSIRRRRRQGRVRPGADGAARDADIKLGAPIISGAKVMAELVEHSRGPEADRFQEAPPQKFAPQEAATSGPLERPHHEHHRRVTRCRSLSRILTMAQKKLAARRETAATSKSNALASSATAASTSSPATSFAPTRHAVAPGLRRRNGHRPHDLRRRRGSSRIHSKRNGRIYISVKPAKAVAAE